MARTPARLPNGTWISDHVTLGVLTTTVPAAMIDAVLAATGRQSRRQRQLPARLVVYYVMALALYAQASYGEVLRCLLEGVRWLRLKGADPALAEYYPAFSPDNTFLLFNESTCPSGTTSGVDCNADSDPSAMLWAARIPSACPATLGAV